MSYPSACRLSRPEGRFGRLNADTLDRLCTFFRVQPGALLEWSPPSHGRQGPKAARAKRVA
ncbi:MAG: helix-turn-helix domain-containing protein [Gemmatimonadales bacterium]